MRRSEGSPGVVARIELACTVAASREPMYSEGVDQIFRIDRAESSVE